MADEQFYQADKKTTVDVFNVYLNLEMCILLRIDLRVIHQKKLKRT